MTTDFIYCTKYKLLSDICLKCHILNSWIRTESLKKALKTLHLTVTPVTKFFVGGFLQIFLGKVWISQAVVVAETTSPGHSSKRRNRSTNRGESSVLTLQSYHSRHCIAPVQHAHGLLSLLFIAESSPF